MNNNTKQILQQANLALNKAIDGVKQKKNEEDRNYILAAIGKDLVYLLEPFLYKIAENSRITKDEIKKLIAGIKVEAPQVNVAPPNIKVETPDAPPIVFPEKEMIKAIRQAFAGVILKAPEVNV